VRTVALRLPVGVPVAAATAAAILTLAAALVVIAFGVIATSGVYGSRTAWLLGVAVPLLAATMVLSWLAVRLSARARPNGSAATPAHGFVVGRVVFVSAGVLFAIPFALAALLLVFYAVIMVLHGLSSLL
jgi:hypothetical protein